MKGKTEENQILNFIILQLIGIENKQNQKSYGLTQGDHLQNTFVINT